MSADPRPPSPASLRARLIVPAWGERYARRLTDLTLPALLAPGNVPYLAASLTLEAVVLTERRLFDTIRSAESFRRLEKHCAVRLVAMDDLLSAPAYYGLTITWSLFRGFVDLGEAMTDTWLLFLNTDFIMADGSYRALIPRLAGTARIVLAPSYCTVEEEALPVLRQRVDPEAQVLAVPPREMADLILDRLHHTVRAKTINRRMYRIERVDQLYYVVDRDTVVARQFPIAIVAMKPERVLTEPVTIWDYGTISEACPTSPLTVLADSDEFLMAELRGRSVASDQLELGWLDPSAIARDLSIWTTRDQRRCSEHTLVLHRGSLSPAVEAGKGALAEFHARVMAEVRPEPVPHRRHPIWTRLQTLHQEWRAGAGAPANPVAADPGIGTPSGRRFGERLALINRRIYRLIFGRLPHVRPGHPYWIDLHPALALIERAARHTKRAVAVCSTPSAVLAPRLRDWFDEVRECRPEEIPFDDVVDFCLVELTREEVLHFRDLHRRLRGMVRPGGHIVVLYRTHGMELLAARDISFITGALPASDVAVVWYRGGRVISALQRRWDEALAGFRRRRYVGGARFIVAALFSAPATWVANRAAERRAERGELPRGCTSVLMDITVL
jgi:hypothetical protein